jgi:hypothetical protein
LRQKQGAATNETRQAYADFLQSRQWDFFATVTSAVPRKDTLAFVRDFDVIAHGHAPGKFRGFVAVEPHRTGMIHIHSLLSYDQSVTPEGRSLYHPEANELQARFNWVFGRSRVDTINSREDVSNYCSKYVTKREGAGYEYDFIGDSW